MDLLCVQRALTYDTTVYMHYALSVVCRFVMSAAA